MNTSEIPNEPQYQAARVHRALAEDPRCAELGIQVTVRAGNVFLCGEVTSDDQRAAVERVTRDAVPGLAVHNDVRITAAGLPTSREELR